jgi:putative transposase
MPNHIHGILILSPIPRRGAALDQDLLHLPDDLCPNATPNPLHLPDDLCPNATPNPLHLPDDLCPNSPSCVPDSIESEPGAAFGQKVVANSENGLANAAPLRAGSVGAIVLNFKSVTTRRINQMRKVKAISVWQRNYYENIIRDENALQIIQSYIYNNPLSWQQDQLHPDNPSKW